MQRSPALAACERGVGVLGPSKGALAIDLHHRLEVWRSYGGEIEAGELWRLLRRWDAFRSEMLAFAERYDLVLCPVFESPARLHGTMNVPGEIDPTSYTAPHSLTGWPAATVRCGTSVEGLPIGVQLVARPWREDVALAAALRLEQEFAGWPPPSLAEGPVPPIRPEG